MIDDLVNWSLKNRFLVVAVYLLVCVWGIVSIYRTPIDAIPDLSENQVIVYAEWNGRSAQELEDQIVYPLSTSLQGLPGVKSVRASSAFGFGMLTVVFEDSTDIYFARTRVLEKLNSLPFKLPEGVVPALGPDATGLGWVYQYYLDDSKARAEGKGVNLGELRAAQDWFVRYQLNSVPGVAEVASVGGFVRQYQIDVNPDRLRNYGLSLNAVLQAVSGANNNVGGGNLEMAGREYTVRGMALVKKVEDLQKIVVGYFQQRPVLLEDVARVGLGPDQRRGALDLNGREVVGGIVIMRYGVSTIDVIERVKAKIAEIQTGLPAGVEIKPFYDRSALIERAVDTLRTTLIEEMILVTLAHIIFLFHFRSIVIVTLPLPLSILIAFILMRDFGITSNIMSLSGIAIAIGVLVDAGVVVTEAVLREAHAVQAGKVPGLQYPRDMIEIVQRATRLVIRPIFYAMAIIILAFVPVFALTGQEGKLFHPLAYTKTFAMAGATLLAVTLVPVLASVFIRGRIHDENENWIMRGLLRVYVPVLRWALRCRALVLTAAALLLLGSLFLATRIGYEFMPPLNERAFLFMPITVPGISLPEVNRVMAAQDKILASFPEVESVVGKLGRAESATDPAPINMIETTIMLKPESQWRPGMTMEKLKGEMQQAMAKFPGFPPAFLQPIQNRVLMLNTGIRGQVAVKIFGENLEELQRLAVETEQLLKGIKGAAGVYAERVEGAPYLEIEVRRDEAARYGVPVQDILEVIETAIGGKALTTTIEGRKRFPVRVRYPREMRDSPEQLRNVLVPSMNGQQVPLGQVADIRVVSGPAMISSENGMMRVFVQANVDGRDLGGFVEQARAVIKSHLKLPPGYFVSWGGEYENLLRAEKTLMTVIPVVVLIILLLLYMIYRSWLEATHVLLAVPFALTGGLILQWLMGYNFSVAVAVGYIALFGTAVQTGVIMVIYLQEAVKRKEAEKGPSFGEKDLFEAIVEGAALRLRPKVMTVATIVTSLLVILIPVFSGTRTGIEIMRPIAVPVIGGMVSSLVHILIVTPVIFYLLRRHELRHKLTPTTPTSS
jgi:Cu(I)/Ag(I) efflux system membrane protein CusA/SilA